MSMIGIDVSKHWLDCHDLISGRSWRMEMGKVDGLQNGGLAVFEATGVYGKRFGLALDKAGIAYAAVDPRRVRRFAQACGQRAKTDRIDAEMIARYAHATGVQAARQSAGSAALRAHVARREQLKAMLQAEQGHREACLDEAINAAIDAHIHALQAMIDEAARAIGQALKTDSRAALLLSMPGIGPITAAGLLAYLPEIGALNRGQAAALAGLAPYARDSGNGIGRRTIQGGRPELRRILYMAALVAIRHNTRFKQRYQHLTSHGKPFKLAITAVMRQMLETLNAMLKANHAWNP